MLKSRNSQGSLLSTVKTAISAALLLGGALLGLAVASADAARVHALLSSEVLPKEESITDIAVNQTTHHFYVTPLSVDTDLNIYNFDPDGKLNEAQPKLPAGPALGPFHVAVDNSGGVHNGYLYVSSFRGEQIQQYDPSGTATAVKITGTAIPPNGTPQGGGLPPVVNDGSFEPFEVAVAPSGNILTLERSSSAIDEFSPAGTFVKQLGTANGFGRFSNGIAIGSSGDIYLSRAAPDSPGSGLFELDPSGECVPASCAPIDPEPIGGVTVDRSTGWVFTFRSVTGNGGVGGEFSEYDSAGNLLGATRLDELHGPSAIAVDEASGRLILGEDQGSERAVKIFGPVEIVPDVETEAAEEVTISSAILKGRIGAAEGPDATCVFQYVSEEEFKVNRGFEGAAEALCQPEGPFAGSAMQAVEAHLSGLRGGTTYHFRLVGSNENGSNPGEEDEFTTKGPSVNGEEVFEVTETAATLEGEVNPHGTPTTYRFQYVTEAAFDASGYAQAEEVPLGGASLGEGIEAISLSQEVKGLSPGTAYRFRILAEGSEGTTAGPDEAFSTFAPPPTGLPDGRAYEQASPIEKGGASLQGEKNAVRASTDGNRITFFSNSGIPGVGDGEQNFPTYLATRAPDGSGWSTQGLFPPASSGPIANIVGWNEELSEVYDFASEPSGPTRLLARSNADGSLSEVASLGVPWTASPFHFAGASAGGAVVLLESEGELLPGDLPGKQNVYAYDRETGSLAVAGVLNDGSVPPGGAMGGPYDWFFGDRTNSGGATATYFTQDQRAISTDGKRIFFTAGGTGQLYVRENPLAPQSAMSGGQCTEAAKACTVRISAPEEGVADPGTPAAFAGASADGSLVYFLDKGKLTAGSTAKGRDLYRYDLESGELTDLTIDHADRNGAQVEGVLGIGQSGEDVYFVANGRLVEGASKAPAGLTNLYAIHGEATELITQMPAKAEAEDMNWTPLSATSGGVLITHTSRVSADGKTLLLLATAKLTSYRNHGVPELYLFRAGEGLSCISCNPTRERPRGQAGVQEVPQPGFSPRRDYAFMTRNLSADGKRVIFDSSDQLISSDENGVNDVYEWEQKGKGSCQSEAYAGGCLFLISSGTSLKPSYFADTDTEGNNVFFFTEQQLVAQDRDQLVDVYDARVGGGIAAQDQPPSPPCEGEACLGPGSSGQPASAGTASFSGPGNPPRPRACAKGRTRRHGRCVKPGHAKKKHHKRHSKRRNARGQRGAGK